jgi:glucose/mannose transport system substrate-binding protein
VDRRGVTAEAGGYAGHREHDVARRPTASGASVRLDDRSHRSAACQEERSMTRGVTRRAWTGLAVLALIISACGPAGTGGSPGATGTAAAACASGATKVEVFSWWTTGGEATGLQKLMDQFNKENPKWCVMNEAVAGGAGANAKAVLQTRMEGGQPPDSFQVHMGHELIDTWVVANKMEPLDDLYTANGWTETFPKGVLDIVSADGHYWSVPVNIHRANVLWYNKKIFADNNLQAPTTWDEFKTAADTLKAKGITALAMGDKEAFASGQILETILISTLGADGYNGLWDGTTKWSDPKVTEALETFKMALGYVNADHSSLTWDQANDLIISGKAAMTIMGDWIDGDYTAKKFTDYGWAPVPGNDGIYDALSDTFGLPKGAKNPEGIKAFLTLLGSAEGQDIFNPLKGSIPARTDAGKPPAGEKQYDDYLKSAQEDWKTDTIVPSVEHGAAAKPSWVTDFQNAVVTFVTSQDVAAAQGALIKAAVDAGFPQ